MLDKILIIIYNLIILVLPYDLKLSFFTYPKILFIYSLVILIYLICRKKLNIKELLKDKTFKNLTIGYLVFFIIISISTITNFIVDKKFVLSNFFEILRIIEYYLIFINYYILINKDTKKSFNISLIFLILLSILISFFQFHNLFNLNELYIRFVAPTQYETLINGYKWPRAVALAGNPNVLGFLMTLASIYVLYLLIKNYKKWYLYIIYALIIICVFLTASRTSYISLIVGNGILIFLTFFKLKKECIIKMFLVGFIFLVFHIVLILALPNSYTWRIKTIIDYKNETSWQKRLDMNEEFLDEIKNEHDDNRNNNEIDNIEENKSEQDDYNVTNNIEENKSGQDDYNVTNNVEENESEQDDYNVTNNIEKNQDTGKTTSKKSVFSLIIGHGPDKYKNKHKGYFDNEWLMIFFHYGFFGVIAYLFMTIYPLCSIKENKIFNYSLYIAVIVANYIYMITASSFNSYLLFGFVSILMSISMNRHIKE